jgi:hypothetical protein
MFISRSTNSSTEVTVEDEGSTSSVRAAEDIEGTSNLGRLEEGDGDLVNARLIGNTGFVIFFSGKFWLRIKVAVCIDLVWLKTWCMLDSLIGCLFM